MYFFQILIMLWLHSLLLLGNPNKFQFSECGVFTVYSAGLQFKRRISLWWGRYGSRQRWYHDRRRRPGGHTASTVRSRDLTGDREGSKASRLTPSDTPRPVRLSFWKAPCVFSVDNWKYFTLKPLEVMKDIVLGY